jgi:nitronate monooxygenase
MGVFTLDSLRYPIVQAPLGGGASTPALAAAVSNAGGLGFLAAGYKSAEAVQTDLDQLRDRLSQSENFGINIFSPPQRGAAGAEIAAYADGLRAEAERSGVALGRARWDDDHYTEKLELVGREHIPVVSFTFGCPSSQEVGRLHDSGAAVLVTVTTAEEAATAAAAGADALIVQGTEAGGHRGGFDDSDPVQFGLIALLQLVRARVGDALPLIATGGIATGPGVAAVLAAGAAAAALGTAFLLCPEAATAPVHQAAIADGGRPTALTRAFTGRTARGIANRFLQEHSAAAPTAYPEVHHLTAPLRAAARARGDADTLHLWAGQAYPLAEPVPAAELVIRLADGARTALAEAAARLDAGVAQASATGASAAKPN